MGDQWSSQQWLEKIEPRIKNGPVEHVVDMPSGPSVDTLWTVWLSAHSSMTRPGVKHVTISSQVHNVWRSNIPPRNKIYRCLTHKMYTIYRCFTKNQGFWSHTPGWESPGAWKRMCGKRWAMPTCWRAVERFCKLLCFPTADYETVDFCRFQTFPTVWSDFSIRLWRGWKMLADVFEAVWSARSPRPMIGRAEWRCLTCCRGGLTQGY